MPRKCLPNQGGHQDENDYIYYDRESGDKAAAKVMETRDNSTELGGESIIEKDNKGTNNYKFELCLTLASYYKKSRASLYSLSLICCISELMEVTEAGNPDDATSKTTHLKSTMVICIYFVMNVNWPLFALNL